MKRLFLLAIIIFSAYLLNACDFGSCYPGLNPHYKKNSIGLRYHYMSYHGTHHDLSEFGDATLSKNVFWEKRSNIELHGQWYPAPRLQLIFSLPYINNVEGMSAKAKQATAGHHHGDGSEGDKPVKGIGDPIVIAQYQLFS